MSTATIPAIYRTGGDVLETNKRRRTVTAVWSTEEPDHYRTVFLQDGIDLSTFARNPIVCWEHRKDPERTRPIGNAIDFGVKRHNGVKALVGTTRFWDDDEWVDRLFRRFASSELRGWSISAAPLEERPPTHVERRMPGWDCVDSVFARTRLLETSAVSIPGNSSTLTIGVERSALGLASHDPDLDHPDPRVRYAAMCRSEYRHRLDAHRARHEATLRAIRAGGR